jgi:hypothetical protein
MKITFKLYATLQGYLPGDAVNNAIEVDIDPQSTLHQVIDRFLIGHPAFVISTLQTLLALCQSENICRFRDQALRMERLDLL